MSSEVSIPSGIIATIKAAIGGGGGAAPKKSFLSSIKLNSFTLLGIITVALLFAIGIFFAVKYFKDSRVPYLNVSDEHLVKEDFVDDEVEEKRSSTASIGRRRGGGGRGGRLDVVEETDEEDELEEEEEEKVDPRQDSNFTSMDDIMTSVR